MVKTVSNPILQLIRRAGEDRRVRELPDHELLQRFHAHQDQAAFHALLCRHGPMVLDVCGGVLANEADAEDAFQAACLILDRKAGSIRKTASVGSWLHGVAYRTALKARAQSAARRKHEARVPLLQAAEPDDLSWREVRQVLDQELSGLPERYRAPLVLCYLESATQQAAAVQLRLAKCTLRERLERGRALLRTRLRRGGLGPAALLVAAAWPAAVESAAVPASLVASTVKAACLFAAGQTLPDGAVPAQAISLAKGALQTTAAKKLLAMLVLTSAIGMVGLAAALGLGPGRPEAGAAHAEEPSGPDRPGHASDAHGDPLPAGALARSGSVRFQHAGPVNSLAYLGQGKILASAGFVGRGTGDRTTQGNIRLWEVETGKELRQFQLQ